MAFGPREVEGAEAAVRRVHKLVNGGVAVGKGEEAGAAENGLDEGLARIWTIDLRGEVSALDRGEELSENEFLAAQSLQSERRCRCSQGTGPGGAYWKNERIVILKVTTRRHVRQPAHFCTDNRRELPVHRMPAEL